LHDVVEDTEVTREVLVEQFGEDVAHLVDALTRRKGESYEKFIDRICAAGLSAIRIKLADIGDNLDPSRRVRLSAEERDKLSAKYEPARTRLEYCVSITRGLLEVGFELDRYERLSGEVDGYRFEDGAIYGPDGRQRYPRDERLRVVPTPLEGP
jgi:hypothetical protein